jgi:type IV secretory pathway VirB10-like protein
MATLAPTEETTLPADSETESEPPPDPHRSKIAPDDPRLRISRARGRTLRKGPALALMLCLLGVILMSLIIALEPASKTGAKKGDATETPAATAPVVPDAIRFAADRPPVVGPPLHLRVHDAGTNETEGLEPEGARGHGNGSGHGRESSAAERNQQFEAEQDWKARTSGVLFESGGMAEGAHSMPSPTSPTGTEAVRSPSGASSASSASDDPNFQEHKNAFLDQLGASKMKNSLGASVEKPVSPYEIQAGSILPAVLLTAINSDLPGPVIGQVRENVYDSVSGNYLLIPQGARILASYDSMVAWGQERVLVCWNRLIFPNGDSLSLECMPAADLDGRAGLTDDVDEHWGRLIKGAAISSLLAATSEAIAGNSEGFNPTVPQMWARSAGSDINGVGQKLTARNLNIQPTITVRAGYSVNVMITKELVVPPYKSTISSSSGRSAASKP